MDTVLMKIVAQRDHFLRFQGRFEWPSTGDCGGFPPNPQMGLTGRRISSSVA
jgi:hypothetical protein